MPAGDTVAFCRGGRWEVGSAGRLFNPRCTATRTCDLRDYWPPGAKGDEPLPVLRTTSQTIVEFFDRSPTRADGGYRVLNLHFLGALAPSDDPREVPPGIKGYGRGVYAANDVDDLEVCGSRFQDLEIGVYLGSQWGEALDAGANGYSDRVVVRGNEFIHNGEQGFLGASSSGRLEYNYFERNGFHVRPGDPHHQVRLHQIYASGTTLGHGTPAKRQGVIRDFLIRGNVLRQSVPDLNGACHGIPIIANGRHSGLVIEDNDIHEERVTPFCWGLGVGTGIASRDYPDPAANGDGHRDVVVRRNRVVGIGNRGINVSVCSECIVEENTIVMGVPGVGIAIDDTPDPNDVQGVGYVVQNNTIVYAARLGSDSRGVEAYTDRSRNQLEPGDFTVTGNIVFFDAGNTSATCFSYPQLGTSPQLYGRTDGNLCFHAPGATGRAWAWGSGSGSIEAFRRAFPSRERSSVVADPLFANPRALDFSLRVGSPMKTRSMHWEERTPTLPATRGSGTTGR